MKKKGNKLGKEVLKRIEARYMAKYESYMASTLEELKELYQGKMSSTDRAALVNAVQNKIALRVGGGDTENEITGEGEE